MRPVAATDFYFLVIIGAILIASRIPYLRVRMTIAKILAELSYRFSHTKRNDMATAIGIAFGHQVNARRLRRIIRGSFIDLWVEVLGLKPCIIDERAVANARIVGWEYLEQALAAGKGVILWEHGAFGRRLLTKQILTGKGIRLHQIKGANHLGCLQTDDVNATWLRAKLIGPFFDRAEKSFRVESTCVPINGDLSYARKILQDLDNNGVVLAAADGELGKQRVCMPFLGRRCTFASGMPNLARLSGASIIPIFCCETDNGRQFLFIGEPLRLERDGDRKKEVERVIRASTQLAERFILRYPTQYRNWHLLGRDRA